MLAKTGIIWGTIKGNVSLYTLLIKYTVLKLAFDLKKLFKNYFCFYRDNTRCQKADNRYELKELESLFNQLSVSNISDLKLEKSLKVFFKNFDFYVNF